VSLRRACLLLFFGVALVYCLSPVVTNSDSYLVVPTAVSIVHERNLDVDEFGNVPDVAAHYAFTEANGHHLNEFPWVVSLFAVPAVLVADIGHAIGVGPGAEQLVRRDEMGLMQLITASLLTAAAIVAIAVLVYERVGGEHARRLRMAMLVAVVVALGTTAWSVASRALWQHGPSILFLTIALVAVGRLLRPEETRARRPPWLYAGAAGATLAVAFAIRPTNALALAGIAVLLLVVRRSAVLPFAAGVAVVLVPWCIVTALAYGQLLQPYGSANRLTLHASYLEALAANVVSPGRGLLLFSPVALLAVGGVIVAIRRSRLDGLLVVSAAVVVLQWLVVSAYGENWVGGHSFGPRFFTDVIPFLVLLALPAVEAIADLPAGGNRVVWLGLTTLLVVVSIGVHAQGGVLRAAQCWNIEPVPVDVDNSRVWSWSDPLLTRGLRRVLEGAPVFQGCDERVRAGATTSQ
jgi:hypothetical protein